MFWKIHRYYWPLAMIQTLYSISHAKSPFLRMHYAKMQITIINLSQLVYVPLTNLLLSFHFKFCLSTLKKNQKNTKIYVSFE